MSCPAQTEYNTKKANNGFRKEDFLNVSKAAEYLKVSSSTLRNLSNEGKIIPIRMDNGYRFYKITDLDALKVTLAIEHEEHKKVRYDHYIKPVTKKTPKIRFNIRQVTNIIGDLRISIAPEFIFLGGFIILAISTFSFINKNNYNKSVMGVNSEQAANVGTKGFGKVLAAKDWVANYVYNINVPTNIKRDLRVDGKSVLTELSFEGVSTIAGLKDIDAVTKDTLETLMGINGDVTGTSLKDVKINDKAVKQENLADNLNYSGKWNFSGTLALKGTTLSATASQLNNLSSKEAELTDLANVSTELIDLSGYNTELVNLASTTYENGGIFIGDGTSLTQDTSGLFWNFNDNRLGISNTNPQYNLDVTGSARFSDNVILSGTNVSLTGTSVLFEQTTNSGNIEFKTSSEGDIRFTSGSNGLIAITPSNEFVYLEGNGLIIGEAAHLFTANTTSDTVQIGTNFYNSNKLNVNGTVGIGSNLFFNNTSGGINNDSSYGLRADSGKIQFKNQSGVWNDIASAGGLSPYGTTGTVQFTDGTNFVGDSSNFNWNNTNKYLTLSAIRSIGVTNPLYITDHNGLGGITVSNTGLVGISNTNPTVALDVTGNVKVSNDIAINGINLGSTATPSGATRIGIQYGSLTNAPLAKNVQEALATLDSVVGAAAGDIQAVGSVTTGQAFNSIATADGQWLGLGSNNGRIAFSTAPGNSQIHLLSANVGIGTTNAQALLDVKGTILAQRFGFTTDPTNYFEYINNSIGIGTSGQTHLFVASNGAVGIGTTATDATLSLEPNVSGVSLNIRNQGELRLYSSDGTYLGFKAPNSAPGNQVYTMPATDGLNNQVLTTDGTGNLTWKTASGVGSSATGDITAVGSMTTGDAFSDSTANNQWLGLGAAAGRIFFSDDTVDEISFLSSNVGIGKTNPAYALDVVGSIYATGTLTGATLSDGTATLTSGTLTALSVGATNVNMSGTLDLGTNTIYDGFLTGNWNFSNGAITALSNVATTNATISGTLSGNIINGNTATISNIFALSIGSTNITSTGTITGATANLATIGSTNITSTGIITGSTANLASIGSTNITSTGTITGNTANITSIGSTSLSVTNTATINTANVTILSDGSATLTGGNFTKLNSVGTTNLTASGTVTLSGVASTNSGTNVLTINTNGTLNYRSIDSRTFGSTLVDGSGISNYLTRWLDSNTINTSSIYDNGTSIGIGTTSLVSALNITPNTTAGIQLNPSGTNPSQLRFYDSDSSNYTGFRSPNSLSSNLIYTLPTGDGLNNYVLSTDGSGTLTWKAVTGVGAGTVGGSGVSNYLSIWTAGDTLGTSALYSDGTSFSIGTTSIAAALNITPSTTSALLINPSGTTPAEIRFADSDQSNYTGFRAPTNMSSNAIYTLPSSTGMNNYVLSTDSSGNLSWVSAPGVGSTSMIDGSGTSNYITKWLDGDTLTTGVLYDNGTNVGVGTTDVSGAKLTVNGTAKATTLTDGTATLTNGTLTALSVGATNVNMSGTLDLGTNTIYDGFLTGNWNFSNGAITALSNVATTNATISGTLSGNIINGNTATISNIFALSIGATNITSTGTITGSTANISSIGTTNITSTGIITGSTANISSIGTTNFTASGSVTLSGVGSTNTGNNLLAIDGAGNLAYRTINENVWSSILTTGTGITNFLTKWDGNTSLTSSSVLYDNGTNIGIGTTNPTVALDVNGQMKVTSSSYPVLNLTRNVTNGGTLFGAQKFILNQADNANSSGLGTYYLTNNSSGTAVNTGYIGSGISANTSGSEIGFVLLKAAWKNGDPGAGENTFGLKLVATGNNTDKALFSGNVGIGTTNPTEKLDVAGNIVAEGSSPYFKLYNTLYGTPGYWNFGYGTNYGLTLTTSYGSGGMFFGINGNIGIGTTIPTNKLDVAGNMALGTYAGTSTAPTNGLIVSGNVGIGTTHPLAKLHVANGNVSDVTPNNFADDLQIETNNDAGMTIASGDNNFGTIAFASASDTLGAQINYKYQTGLLNIEVHRGSAGALTFSSGAVEKMRMNNDGNLGIGTSAPTYKLDVNGTVRTNSSVNFTGLGSTDSGNNVLTIDGNGKLDYRNVDSRIWETILTDGTGTSNYLSRWIDGNTLGNSSLYESGSSVGLGTTSMTSKLEISTGAAENKTALILNQTNLTNNPKVLAINNSGTGDAIYVDSGEFVLDSTGNITTTGTTGITLNTVANLLFGTIGIKDVGTTETNSGAYILGFYGVGNSYATASNIQLAIEQLDQQLQSVIGGFITGVGSMSTGDVFSDSSANGQWLGLGSNAGRIHFIDSATDKISVLSAYLGIGTSNPLNSLDVSGSAVIGSGYAGTYSAPSNGLLVQGSLGLGVTSPLNKLDVAGGAVIGSGYAGISTSPSNGLLVQGVLGIGTSSVTNGFEAYINGDLGIAQGGYLNIGTTYGASGYGLRDYNGIIQAKDLNGSWVELVGGGFWNLTGSSAPTATVSLDQTYAYNLGIGTTSARFNIELIGSGLFGSNGGGTQGLYVGSNGNVGIGITNPQKGFDVNTETLFRNNVYFAGGTSYYVDNTGNATFKNLLASATEDPFTGTASITAGNGTNGSIKLGNSYLSDLGNTYLSIMAGTTNTSLGLRVYDNGNIWNGTGVYTSGVIDSSTATGFTFTTTTTFTSPSAKIFSVQNNGSEKMYLDASGNLYVSGSITAGNGMTMLLTNKSSDTAPNRSLVIIDVLNDSSFTTTTTAYSKGGYGVVVGVGAGVANDVDGDGVCDINDKCMVAYGGEVEVLLKNASSSSKGNYLYTSDTARYAGFSAKQSDGLLGVITNTSGAASGYVKMIFQAQPQVTAIAAMDKTSKHNEYWLYSDRYNYANNGSDINANLLTRGMAFDTLKDVTKIDATNTTVSVNTYNKRAGLIGGQGFTQGTTDNYGNTLLGSTAITDMQLYDRTVQDSKPEVLVELGIDPNWYNGVTLTTIDTSTAPTPSINKNLSTTYNGSLLKVTGIYTTNPATIYITIKPLNTFDWTDNQGNSATNVTMTAGLPQQLGTTGVYVTFTPTAYHIGDVFRIASWFVEPASSTRGTKQQFPERSYVIASGATASTNYVDIVDADSQKLWMRFNTSGNTYAGSSTQLLSSSVKISSIKMLNGTLYVGKNGGASEDGFDVVRFLTDGGEAYYSTNNYKYNGIIATRNTPRSPAYSIVGSSKAVVTNVINDIDAAVIPNDVTKEVTVSGWGFQNALAASGQVLGEQIILPYKFNNTPTISVSIAGYSNGSDPSSLQQCSGAGTTLHGSSGTITNNSFYIYGYSTAGTWTNYRVCYTWTAKGTVSPKQFVAAATGATSSDGGTTVINETDGTKADIGVGSQYADAIWQNKVVFGDNQLFIGNNNSTSNTTNLSVYEGLHGLSSETSIHQYRKSTYGIGVSNFATPVILGSSTGTLQINSLSVTPKASNLDSNGSKIFVGTIQGITVINEVRDFGNWGVGNPGDGASYATSSVKYYTKDYISEDMVGDIRGMWPLSSGTALSMSDASAKADTLTNNGTVTAVSGVRGMAASFNGSSQYLSCTDASCGGTSKLDIIGISTAWSMSSWIKTSATTRQAIISKGTTNDYSYEIEVSTLCSASNAARFAIYQTGAGSPYVSTCGNTSLVDGKWHYVVGTWDGTTIKIYVDGVLQSSSSSVSGTPNVNSAANFVIGGRADGANYFNGVIDEPWVTATALTSDQIKQMYDTGARALANHNTSLGGGSTDANQQLGFAGVGTSSIGVVMPDWNNQYMYASINDATNGGVSKIDIKSDTNVRTYKTSANTPTGGTTLPVNNINSMAVGYDMEAVGASTYGIKTMGVDDYSTSTSGNFVGKTITTKESFNQAYLWAQYETDSNDASNTVQVWASNDGGSNYYQCNLLNTDSSVSPTEYEYFCQFNVSGSSLKTKFIFNRGSTKTNTYLKKYGIAWIDTNNVAAVTNGTNFYTSSGTAVSGSYLQVAHNQNTSDVVTNAWVNTGTKWEQIDASYKPAIAWEGKDAQRNNYHEEATAYTPSSEANAYTQNLIDQGLLLDTFEDNVKEDATSTVSSDTQSNDTGTKSQQGRIGLFGGQAFTQGTTDTYGNTVLGSTAITDMYFYDRTVQDSKPEVLVELGIDPNWYNGVTLTTIDTTTAPMGNVNKNLSTTYNGSLLKVTGTYTTNPGTIYITIKPLNTFDWTDNQGNSATNVTMTAGLPQQLGTTGVYVTFTNTTYHVGDVFRIASWFVEPASSIRGTNKQFPERATIISSGTTSPSYYIDIVDTDTQKLWMRFNAGVGFYLRTTANRTTQAITMLNGKLYFGQKDPASANSGIFERVNFDADSANLWTSAYKYTYSGGVASRNIANNLVTINSSEILVATDVNDVAAAVIPNDVTKEVTVSGWGYIYSTAGGTVGETVPLPYTFKEAPNISVKVQGMSSTVPTSIASCAGNPSNFQFVGYQISNNQIGVSGASNGGGISGNYYFCYTWTAVGKVSPKQFIAVATGATGADGGTTIINETDGTKADVIVGSQYADVIWQDKVALAKDGTAYISSNNSTQGTSGIQTYYGIHGLKSETSINQYLGGAYFVQSASYWSSGGPVILGAGGTSQIKSLTVGTTTTTSSPSGNTLYIGTTKGVTVLNEKQGKGNTGGSSGPDSNYEKDGSVKYYTNDYISEEMIGDIRGMWPLNAVNANSDLEDVSIKANVLTSTNITSADSVSGVRNDATDFDGSTEVLTRADDADFESMSTMSVGAWIKTSDTGTVNAIISKWNTNVEGSFSLYTDNNGKAVFFPYNAGTLSSALTGNTVINDNQWHHVVGVLDSTGRKIYIDGRLDVSDSQTGTTSNTAANLAIGARYVSSALSDYFAGYIDEVFITATPMSVDQIKNMYQVGANALRSHGTTLGGGAADTNQRLGFAGVGTTSIGVVMPDFKNQYMYASINDATNGGVSKIDLNSDTNIKTYTSSANVPTGGPTLPVNNITSMAVGYNLEAVGASPYGIKTMGSDNYATSTSGNFFSKTYTLPKNVSSAVIWASPVTDTSDASNTLVVKASNDGGVTYDTCSLITVDTSTTVPENEYSCEWPSAGNQLKIKFEMARGSTKTNTYITQYGVSWLGETGFRLEQTDSNTVRLYNYTGDSRDMRLDVIAGASKSNLGTVSLAPLAADVDSQDYANSIWINKTGTAGNLLKLQTSGSDKLTLAATGTLTLSGDFLPSTNNTYSLGSDTARFKDLFVGPSSLHIGTSTSDEYTIGYDTVNNTLGFNVNGSGNPEIVFSSNGNVGIGTTSPTQKLFVEGNVTSTGSGVFLGLSTTDITATGNGNFLSIGTTNLTARGTVTLTSISASTDNTVLLLDASNKIIQNEIDSRVWGNTLLSGEGTANYLAKYSAGTAMAISALYENASGNIGLGTTVPVAIFSIADSPTGGSGIYVATITNGTNSNTGSNYILRLNTNNTSPTTTNVSFINFTRPGPVGMGSISSNGASNVQYNTSSDRRIKQNIVDLDNALDKVMQMQARKFEFIYEPGVTYTGFIAQELKGVFPEAVSGDEEHNDPKTNPMGVDYGRVTPLLAGAIKELNQKVDKIIGTDITTLYDQVLAVKNDIMTFMSTMKMSATSDGKLLIDNDMNVTGLASLKDVNVAGKFNVGSISMDSLSNSIEILGPACGETKDLCSAQTIYIQKNLAGNIDLLNGKVQIMTNGDVKIDGNLEAKTVTTEELKIKSASKTTGSGTLLKGETSVKIDSVAVKNNSKIFITATTETGEPLYINEKVEGQNFTVSIKNSMDKDIQFDWFIVNIQE